MYAFAQRPDTQVYDEPLYGYYLQHSPAKHYHPGAEEIMATMETDGSRVVETMLQADNKPVLFFKNMTHHLLPDLPRHFMPALTHIILTRHPQEMLASYAKVIDTPTQQDVGYAMQVALLEALEQSGIPVVVVDSKTILQQPEAQLRKLCAAVDIPFYREMLAWPAGPRPEDGCWAPYWYANVHKSTGFGPWQPPAHTLPEHLVPLLEECLPFYERLSQRAL